MTDERNTPDVDRLARSMLRLYGALDHGDHAASRTASGAGRGTWAKAPTFDPERAAAIRAATERDRERYLRSGLRAVDCRFCHVTVEVKKLGPDYTAVQWTTEATRRCAHFSAIRAAGGEPARERSCPKLSDSIKHALAEGYLEQFPSDPPPGDG